MTRQRRHMRKLRRPWWARALDVVLIACLATLLSPVLLVLALVTLAVWCSGCGGAP